MLVTLTWGTLEQISEDVSRAYTKVVHLSDETKINEIPGILKGHNYCSSLIDVELHIVVSPAKIDKGV